MAEELDQSNATIESLQGRLDGASNLDRQLQDRNRQLNLLTSQLAQQQVDTKTANDSDAGAKQTREFNQELAGQVEQLRLANQSLEARLATARAEAVVADQTISEHQTKLDLLQRDRNQQQAKLDDQSQQLAQVSQLKSANLQLRSDVSELTTQLRHQEAKHEKQIDEVRAVTASDFQDQLQTSQSSLTSSRIELKHYQQLVSELKSQVSGLKSKASKLEQQALDSADKLEIAEAKANQVVDERVNQDQQSSQMSTAPTRGELKHYQQLVSEFKSQVSELKSQSSKLERQAIDSADKQKIAEAKANELVDECFSQDQQATKLSQQLNSLQRQIVDKTNAYEKERSNWERKFKEKDITHADALIKKEAQFEKASASSMTSARIELRHYQQHVTSLTKQVSESRSRETSLEQRLQESEHRHQLAESKINEASTQKVAQDGQIDELGHQLALLQKQVNDENELHQKQRLVWAEKLESRESDHASALDEIKRELKREMKAILESHKVAEKQPARKRSNTKPLKDGRVTRSKKQADDLTRIVGVGPVAAAKLRRRGVKSFKQIAAWTQKDVQKFSDALSVGQRVRNEAWVQQAKDLIKSDRQ